MLNKKEDKHYWNFKGADLTKRETKIVALTLLFGFLGAILAYILPFEKSRVVGFGIASLFALVAYVIGRRKMK